MKLLRLIEQSMNFPQLRRDFHEFRQRVFGFYCQTAYAAVNVITQIPMPSFVENKLLAVDSVRQIKSGIRNIDRFKQDEKINADVKTILVRDFYLACGGYGQFMNSRIYCFSSFIY